MIDEAKVIKEVRGRIWEECDPIAIAEAGADKSRCIVEALSRNFITQVSEAEDLSESAVSRITEGVVAATLGFGPLHSLLADPSISEIMVNDPSNIFIERHGRIERSEAKFEDEEHILRVIDRILAPIGRRVDALSPMVDARLEDGSRVNVVIPPLSITGPILTIRRFVAVADTLDDLVRLGSLTAASALEIERIVVNKLNVLVSGGTSTGKTTLLASALSSIAKDERIIVLEDAAELPIDHPHCIRLEAKVSATESDTSIGMQELVKNSLRMRPDRIILGEVRGSEANDLLQALNTGHRGSWSTIHANGVEEALLRLESLALSANTGVPHTVIRETVARSIDVVIQLERKDNGCRIVSDIALVTHNKSSVSGWELNSLNCTYSSEKI